MFILAKNPIFYFRIMNEASRLRIDKMNVLLDNHFESLFAIIDDMLVRGMTKQEIKELMVCNIETAIVESLAVARRKFKTFPNYDALHNL